MSARRWSATSSSRRPASSSRSSSRSAAASSSSSSRSTSGGSRRSAPSPAEADEASQTAMRLLKRMKPNQLRDLSQAAAALEKEKLAKLELEKKKREDKEKVAAFIAKNKSFVDLVGDCYICLEPLLNNIGTTKFGVVSWKCRCTVPQKAHTGCLFSKISRQTNGQATCDMCSSPIKFERTLGGRSTATIRFVEDPVEEVELSDSSDDESSSSEQEEEEEGNSSEEVDDSSGDDSSSDEEDSDE